MKNCRIKKIHCKNQILSSVTDCINILQQLLLVVPKLCWIAIKCMIPSSISKKILFFITLISSVTKTLWNLLEMTKFDCCNDFFPNNFYSNKINSFSLLSHSCCNGYPYFKIVFCINFFSENLFECHNFTSKNIFYIEIRSTWPNVIKLFASVI